MRSLNLDLGTQLGWCLAQTGAGGSMFISGTKSFQPARHMGAGMRYLLFSQWLTEMHKKAPIERVYFEEVRRHAATTAAHVYGGLMATLLSWCELHSIPYLSVPVQTIKIFGTGKGNAKKEDMIFAAEVWGFHPADDNEADAIVLAHYTVAEFPAP